jgi:hypothetical protein
LIEKPRDRTTPDHSTSVFEPPPDLEGDTGMQGAPRANWGTGDTGIQGDLRGHSIEDVDLEAYTEGCIRCYLVLDEVLSTIEEGDRVCRQGVDTYCVEIPRLVIEKWRELSRESH